MFHRGQLPGHTPAILEEKPAMVCDGLRGSAMLLNASKSQQNGPFLSHCVAGPLHSINILLRNGQKASISIIGMLWACAPRPTSGALLYVCGHDTCRRSDVLHLEMVLFFWELYRSVYFPESGGK